MGKVLSITRIFYVGMLLTFGAGINVGIGIAILLGMQT